MLEFNNFSLINAERCEKGFNMPLDAWNVMEWACAVAGETGEMCNYAKKLKRLHDGVQPDKDKNITEEQLIENIGKELADIVIYCDLLASSLNMRLGYLVKEKFNETSLAIKSNCKLK